MNEEKPQSSRKPSTQQMTEAQLFKEQGNEYFKGKNYEQALKMYQNAIEKDPTNSIFYSNKARCLFNLKKYQQALLAAEASIKRDEKNIKAYYLAAESHVEISEGTKDVKKIQAAIQQLKRSLTLCPSQGKGQFQTIFIDKIYRAKKKLWLLINQQQQEKRKAIRKYLIHLVETDKTLTEQSKDQLNDKILKLVQNDTGKDHTKIPSALICPITKMLLKDPVCNEHGHSYSKVAYLQYLQENGGKDPITSKPVKKNIMYPNINVKKAVEMFLEEHPWTYDEVLAS